MLGRRSPVKDDQPVSDALDLDAADAGKGRPTPKRSDARKARRSITPRNRKEAAAFQREKRREQRLASRRALMTGDERHLPPRDAGAGKRLARDIVDSRFTYGQVFFGLIFLVFAISLVPVTAVREIANWLALFSLLMMVVDGARNARLARRIVVARYGEDEARGVSSYAFMRSLMPKRFRRPPPKVKRGDPVAAEAR
ncbi:MAG TPA: DUF3043 domain-containing protein [Mycobacteriales bacterium]|nr:DUF3043 domain-containing protein [Mycobacteriales bacterium]